MLLKSWGVPQERFVIYGNGMIAHLIYSLLEKEKKEKKVVAFIVTEGLEGKYRNVPVTTVSALERKYKGYPVLVGVENIDAKRDIVEKLREIGIYDYILPNRVLLAACFAYQRKCRRLKIESLLGLEGGLFYRAVYYLHKRIYISLIGKRKITFKLFNKNKFSMRLFSRDLDFFEDIYVGSWDSNKNQYIGEYDFLLKNVDTVFDFGANIGLFTMKFAPFFPGTQFIAVEPEIQNYRILHENLKKLENTKCMRKGVWYRDAYCKVFPGRTIVFPSNTPSEGSFYIGECQKGMPGSIEALSVAKWVKKFTTGKYVIKMDIEGAEKEIFELGNLNWLDDCVQLIIEVHCRHRKDNTMGERIIRIMQEKGFIYRSLGENLIFER